MVRRESGRISELNKAVSDGISKLFRIPYDAIKSLDNAGGRREDLIKTIMRHNVLFQDIYFLLLYNI